MIPDIEDSTAGSLADRRILFVDDDATMRGLMSTFSRMLGATPVEWGSAEEALAYLAHQTTPDDMPDVMVVDVELPGMDGITFCQKLSEWWKFPLDHIVIISGTESREDRRRISALGPRRFLRKPFLLEDFQDALCVPS